MQVYDGGKANWRETDRCHPVNAYGRTKLEAEQLIQVLAAPEQAWHLITLPSADKHAITHTWACHDSREALYRLLVSLLPPYAAVCVLVCTCVGMARPYGYCLQQRNSCCIT